MEPEPAVSPYRVSGRRAGLRFDAECSVSTEALVFLRDLDPDAVGASLVHATHYEPTPVGDVGRLLDLVPFDVARATFVDVGAGMGRALLEAARRPFRSCLGIEISPALAAVARENLARYAGPPLRCRDLRIVRADALTARLPRGDLVVYLYNPFDAAVLAPLVDRIARRRGHETAVLYHTPVERAAIEAHPAYELVGELPFGIAFSTVPPPDGNI